MESRLPSPRPPRSTAFVSTALLAPLTFSASATAPPSAPQGRVRVGPGAPLAGAPVVLAFETEDDFVTPLANGQALTTVPEFGNFVRISSAGANAGAAVFDSDPGGPNRPSQDRDLLVGRGNLVILQNSAVSTQSVPDLFDRPNDDQDGGELVFAFVGTAEPRSLVLVDIDAGTQQASRVTLTDRDGRTRVYTVPPRWTEDLLVDGPPGWRTLDLRTLAPQPGFAATATATEQAGYDPANVRELRVHLGSSGAVDDLTLARRRSIGMAADGSGPVHFFDADTHALLGSVPTGPAASDRDCAVVGDRLLAFATDFLMELWVYDLSVTPPVLAAGVNPIPIAQPGLDLSVSPDQRLLAVGGSGAPNPLSLVDPVTRVEVHTLSAPLLDFCCVDFGRDDLLLVGSNQQSRISSVTIAADGAPSFMGEFLSVPSPTNVYAAQGGRAGIAIPFLSHDVPSFRVDGMTVVSTRFVPDIVKNGAFTPNGRRFFVRGLDEVFAFDFNPLSGALGAAPRFSFPVIRINPTFGTDNLVVHPDGDRLFVVNGDGIQVRRTVDGVLVDFIATPIPVGAGIAVGRVAH